MKIHRKMEPIGKMLLKKGRIDTKQLQDALNFQATEGGRLCSALVKLNIVTEHNLEQSVEELTAVPGGIIEEWEEDPEGISTPWNEKHGKKKR